MRRLGLAAALVFLLVAGATSQKGNLAFPVFGNEGEPPPDKSSGVPSSGGGKSRRASPPSLPEDGLSTPDRFDTSTQPSLRPRKPTAPPNGPSKPRVPEQPFFPPSTPQLPPFPPSTPDIPSPPPSPPPVFCPRLPPYPGIQSIQITACDLTVPDERICGLDILSGGGFRLQPGTFLGVEYRGLAAQPPLLSRLVLGGEQLNFALAPSPEGGPDQLVLVASGLCPDLDTLAACLHDAYHGAVPSYRSACTACYGVNVVYELGQLGETIGWAGAAATVGDTSYYRSSLPEELDSLIYFVGSLSSNVLELSYGRRARVLYLPGAPISLGPPSNFTFSVPPATPPPAAPPPSPAPLAPAPPPGVPTAVLDSEGQGVGHSVRDVRPIPDGEDHGPSGMHKGVTGDHEPSGASDMVRDVQSGGGNDQSPPGGGAASGRCSMALMLSVVLVVQVLKHSMA